MYKKWVIIALITVLDGSFFGLSAFAQTSPTVTTGEAVFISANNVYLTATVNPHGSFTQVRFQIGSTQPLVTMVGSMITTGTQTSPVYVRTTVEDLKPDTTYYYRPVAQNSSGFAYGEIRSFKTPSAEGSVYSGNNVSSNNNTSSSNSTSNNNNNVTGSTNNNPKTQSAPQAVTNGPASVSVNSAVINGSLSPNGASTNFWFEFGVTQSLGQITPSQSTGSGNLWLLVTGNLLGLESGKTYYYRVVAQNNYGISRGDIVSFTAGANQAGQISGAVSGHVKSSSPTARSNSPKSSVSNTAQSQRSPFVYLEHSLNDDGVLVLVVDDVKPRAGEEFSYTIVYKNSSAASLSDAKLKVILPLEVNYSDANRDPYEISGNIIEFNLGNLKPQSQDALVVIVRVKESVQPGANLIFTSVLTHQSQTDSQLAATAYMTLKIGRSDASTALSASLAEAFTKSSYTAILWLIVSILIGVMAMLLYRLRRKNSLRTSSPFFPISSDPILPTHEPVRSFNPARDIKNRL